MLDDIPQRRVDVDTFDGKCHMSSGKRNPSTCATFIIETKDPLSDSESTHTFYVVVTVKHPKWYKFWKRPTIELSVAEQPGEAHTCFCGVTKLPE